MGGPRRNRLLVERPLPRDGRERGSKAAPARSVTVNLAESPLGWLRARGLVTERQYEAGERLRGDWEKAQIEPSTTMKWDAPPTGKVARGAPEVGDPREAQLAAKLRFEHASGAVGSGLSEILWRVVCAGEGMRDAERALGWPVRAGKLVLGLALDRLADYYSAVEFAREARGAAASAARVSSSVETLLVPRHYRGRLIGYVQREDLSGVMGRLGRLDRLAQQLEAEHGAPALRSMIERSSAAFGRR